MFQMLFQLMEQLVPNRYIDLEKKQVFWRF
jgi:hypothetical protein